MAGLLQETQNGKRCYRVKFKTADGRYRKIWLGNVPKKTAEQIRNHVETIVSHQAMGQPLPLVTSAWIADLGDSLKMKMVNAGLCEASLQDISLGEFAKGFYRAYQGGEHAQKNMRLTIKRLNDFFGEETMLKDLTSEAGHKWRFEMGGEIAEATAAGHVKRARQIMTDAIKQGYVDLNPFAEVKTGSQDNPERSVYV